MELRIADFEKLTGHYQRFRDGMKVIEHKKEEFLKKIEPLKNEMNNIIQAHNSGLVLDNRSTAERQKRFTELQQEFMSLEKDINFELKKYKENLTKNVYDDLEDMVKNYAVDNKIDCVMGKLECVYISPEFEITDEILEVLKSKGQFVEMPIEKEEQETESQHLS
jgi:Skp family chaperone for outer membrane proteins